MLGLVGLDRSRRSRSPLRRPRRSTGEEHSNPRQPLPRWRPTTSTPPTNRPAFRFHDDDVDNSPPAIRRRSPSPWSCYSKTVSFSRGIISCNCSQTITFTFITTYTRPYFTTIIFFRQFTLWSTQPFGTTYYRFSTVHYSYRSTYSKRSYFTHFIRRSSPTTGQTSKITFPCDASKRSLLALWYFISSSNQIFTFFKKMQASPQIQGSSTNYRTYCSSHHHYSYSYTYGSFTSWWTRQCCISIQAFRKLIHIPKYTQLEPCSQVEKYYETISGSGTRLRFRIHLFHNILWIRKSKTITKKNYKVSYRNERYPNKCSNWYCNAQSQGPLCHGIRWDSITRGLQQLPQAYQPEVLRPGSMYWWQTLQVHLYVWTAQRWKVGSSYELQCLHKWCETIYLKQKVLQMDMRKQHNKPLSLHERQLCKWQWYQLWKFDSVIRLCCLQLPWKTYDRHRRPQTFWVGRGHEEGRLPCHLDWNPSNTSIQETTNLPRIFGFVLFSHQIMSQGTECKQADFEDWCKILTNIHVQENRCLCYHERRRTTKRRKKPLRYNKTIEAQTWYLKLVLWSVLFCWAKIPLNLYWHCVTRSSQTKAPKTCHFFWRSLLLLTNCVSTDASWNQLVSGCHGSVLWPCFFHYELPRQWRRPTRRYEPA